MQQPEHHDAHDQRHHGHDQVGRGEDRREHHRRQTEHPQPDDRRHPGAGTAAGGEPGHRGHGCDHHRHAGEQDRLVRQPERGLGELGDELRGEPDHRVPHRQERRRRR
jgi:hypothetical protein